MTPTFFRRSLFTLCHAGALCASGQAIAQIAGATARVRKAL